MNYQRIIGEVKEELDQNSGFWLTATLLIASFFIVKSVIVGTGLWMIYLLTWTAASLYLARLNTKFASFRGLNRDKSQWGVQNG